MKTKEISKSKMPVFVVDERLNKYDGKILFPKKVTEAKEFIARAGLPWDKKKS